MKLKEFYEQVYLPDHISTLRSGTQKKKLTAFERYILPMFGERELDQFNKLDWRRFTNELQHKQKLSNKTIRNHQSDLQHIFKFAVSIDYLAQFPSLPLIKFEPAPPKPLSTIDRKAFVAAIMCEPLHYRAMAVFALATGMRVGELRGLQWKDFETEETLTAPFEVIRVRRSISGRFNDVGDTKSGRERVIPLNAEALQIKKSIYSGQEGSMFVFSKPEQPFVALTYKAVDCAIKRICRRAGVKAVGWHALRHTVCTQMLARDVNLVKASKIMGHVDTKTTMRYVKVSAVDLLSAVATLEQAK